MDKFGGSDPLLREQSASLLWFTPEFYGSYQNFTITVTWPATGCPFLVAGLYW
jgi:hypothetical protein